MSGNKVAVVTGANKGLGLAMVKGLCTKFRGTVYLTSRNEERGKKACKELIDAGLSPEYHQLDITQAESIEKFIKFLKQRHGKIDLLINNVGILYHQDSTEPKLIQADETIFVNFICMVTFTEAIIPMINDNGSIVNITSSSGHLSRIPSDEIKKKISSKYLDVEGLFKLMVEYIEGVRLNREVELGWGSSPYVISKVGVNAYTFMLNRNLAHRGILVNCVHPGYVMSDMTRGVGSMTPDQAAVVPLKLALHPIAGGMFVWHNQDVVPWDGPDPRGYIDGQKREGN